MKGEDVLVLAMGARSMIGNLSPLLYGLENCCCVALLIYELDGALVERDTQLLFQDFETIPSFGSTRRTIFPQHYRVLL